MLITAHKTIHPADTCNVPAYLKTNLEIEKKQNVRFKRSRLGPTFAPLNSNLKTVGDRFCPFGIPQLITSNFSFNMMSRFHASRSQW